MTYPRNTKTKTGIQGGGRKRSYSPFTTTAPYLFITRCRRKNFFRHLIYFSSTLFLPCRPPSPNILLRLPPKPDFTQTSSPHVKSIFLPLLHFVPHSKRFVTLFSPQAKKLSFLYPMPCFSEKMSKPFHAQHVSLNRRKYVILKI